MTYVYNLKLYCVEIGYVTGWLPSSAKGGHPAKLYILAIPGVFESRCVQLVKLTTNSSLYGNIDRKKRRLKSAQCFVIGVEQLFYLFPVPVLFSVSWPNMQQEMLQEEFRKLNGSYADTRASRSWLGSKKKWLCSVILAASIAHHLMTADKDLREHASRVRKELKTSKARSGSARMTDSVIDTTTIKRRDLPFSFNAREDLIAKMWGAFEYSFNQADLVKAYRSLKKSLLAQYGQQRGEAYLAKVMALFFQDLTFKIVPTPTKAVTLDPITFDLDYIHSIFTVPWHMLMERAGLRCGQDIAIPLSTEDPILCQFLHYWSYYILAHVMRIPTLDPLNFGHYRARGVSFTFNIQVRKKAWKNDFFYIAAHGAHDDVLNMAMYPISLQHGVSRKTIKDDIFKVQIAIAEFIERILLSAGQPYNINDFAHKRNLKGDHKWTVYGGPLFSLLVPLLFSAALKTDVIIALQSYNGKKSGISVVATCDDANDISYSQSSVVTQLVLSAYNGRMIQIITEYTKCMLQGPNGPRSQHEAKLDYQLGVGATISGKTSNGDNAWIEWGGIATVDNATQDHSAEASSLQNDLYDKDAIAKSRIDMYNDYEEISAVDNMDNDAIDATIPVDAVIGIDTCDEPVTQFEIEEDVLLKRQYEYYEQVGNNVKEEESILDEANRSIISSITGSFANNDDYRVCFECDMRSIVLFQLFSGMLPAFKVTSSVINPRNYPNVAMVQHYSVDFRNHEGYSSSLTTAEQAFCCDTNVSIEKDSKVTLNTKSVQTNSKAYFDSARECLNSMANGLDGHSSVMSRCEIRYRVKAENFQTGFSAIHGAVWRGLNDLMSSCRQARGTAVSEIMDLCHMSTDALQGIQDARLQC